MVEELELVDVWRRLNPGRTQFTFYSNPHKSWSRIDMAWVNGNLLKEVQDIKILTNIWADHNPLQIIWKDRRYKKSRWTLNSQLLKEQGYTQKIKEELIGFFNCNRKQDTSLQNLWDTMKAYLRGISIAYTANKN
uniref:Endonuclease/exonuclease/phosphatase domain-containing protein n=1 Tax=Micrurus surinamensis TaxID=129470 RepID=A0A2D4PQA1_MICSU